MPNFCSFQVCLKVITLISLPVKPSFRLLDFGVLEKDSARMRSLLSMGAMLLGYNFQRRPNSRALATAGPVLTIGL